MLLLRQEKLNFFWLFQDVHAIKVWGPVKNI